MAKTSGVLLPAGRDVPFAEIEVTLARLVRHGSGRKGAPARALTATVIVVAPPDRLAAAAEAIEQLGDVGVRAILISEGTRTAPIARVTENAIAIAGLAPRFLNNAVAALRLSSLPAVVWWRGGSVEALDDLADLSDRMILDAESAADVWPRASAYFERTALTDLRWTRLTRWRAALAHLFDLQHVRDGAAGVTRVSIAASDSDAARLFGGWLRTRLRWTNVPIEVAPASGSSGAARTPLTHVALEGPRLTVTLDVKEDRSCLVAAVEGDDASARIVPLGDGSLGSLIGEELAIRTRDLAFEQALVSALEKPL